MTIHIFTGDINMYTTIQKIRFAMGLIFLGLTIVDFNTIWFCLFCVTLVDILDSIYDRY